MMHELTPPAVNETEDDKVRLDIEWQSEADLANREKWYTIAGQVFIPFLIAGFGTVAAGLVLERSKALILFRTITEIYVLVPTLLGLKGNLEMTLASRLSTQANIGNMEKAGALRNMIIGNLILTQLQAIVVGFLAALVAIFVGWIPQGYINVQHAVILCSSSMVTASLASLVLGIIMITVIIFSHKCRINPDNVATPIAASLGDLTTLSILAGIGSSFFHLANFHIWFLITIISICLLVIPIWIYMCNKNEFVKDVLYHGWSPILSAMLISSGGGLILDYAVQSLRGVAVFQPVINGVGGNLVAVFASRLSTSLHLQGKPGEFQMPNNQLATKGCPTFSNVFLSNENSALTARILMLLVIPGHLTFVFIIWIWARNDVIFSFSLIILFLVAALIQVAILIYTAQWLVSFTWRHRRDPDTVCIPYLTAIGDLIGTGLLTCVFVIIKYW